MNEATLITLFIHAPRLRVLLTWPLSKINFIAGYGKRHRLLQEEGQVYHRTNGEDSKHR